MSGSRVARLSLPETEDSPEDSVQSDALLAHTPRPNLAYSVINRTEIETVPETAAPAACAQRLRARTGPDERTGRLIGT